MLIGPDIKDGDAKGDLDGDGSEDAVFDLMDQNQNGVGGEESDRYGFLLTRDTSVDLGGLVDDITAELIGDARADITRTRIGSIIIHYTRTVDPVQANTLRNYSIVSPGADRRFGNPGDSVMALRAVKYDAEARSATLTPAAPLPHNQVFQIRVSGLTDPTGTALDGDGDGMAGGEFLGTFALGTRIFFFDRDGDDVVLSLENGGIMEIITLPAHAEPALFLNGTISTRSVLSGRAVRSGFGGNGKLTLVAIGGMEGVTNHLPQSVAIRRR